ncbi:MAG: hypothetical protein M3N28_05130 [Actinomycetota bacterium]|nr:hypothetical protein [Actinomycetota bacterium]
MTRKKRTPQVLTASEVTGAMRRLSSTLRLRAEPLPWDGGDPPDVDLDALAEVYARQRRRLVTAAERADPWAPAMVAMFEDDREVRARARSRVEAKRAYWQRRMREVPAVDPALAAGGG